MKEEKKSQDNKILEDILTKRDYEIIESKHLLKLSKEYIDNNQPIGRDLNIEFRRGILSKGIGRISFYNWFRKEIHFKTKNIKRVENYLIELGIEIDYCKDNL